MEAAPFKEDDDDDEKDTLDRPLIHEPSFLKINLGHVVTVSVLIGGFFVTNAVNDQRSKDTFDALRDKITSVSSDISDLHSAVKAFADSKITEQLTIKDLTDKFDAMSNRINGHAQYLESLNSRMNAQESFSKTLDTNQQLINQQIGFIGKNRK